MSKNDLEKREAQVLNDKKWIRFLEKTWVFRHIPFVEFALAAGSMALGNVHEDSDFDVIIGARKGRIFTVRAFSIIFFGFLGWRKKKWEHDVAARDKICLNHFVTEDSYELSPPYNKYWQALYRNLVPIYGNPELINRFFLSNQAWLDANKLYGDDLRHLYRRPSIFKIIIEKILRGSFGNWVESLQRNAQTKRIKKGLKDQSGYEPRIIYNDEELEFHPDTERMLRYK
jgi:hypothetical protein